MRPEGLDDRAVQRELGRKQERPSESSTPVLGLQPQTLRSLSRGSDLSSLLAGRPDALSSADDVALPRPAREALLGSDRRGEEPTGPGPGSMKPGKKLSSRRVSRKTC